jgi:hypothetical protein
VSSANQITFCITYNLLISNPLQLNLNCERTCFVASESGRLQTNLPLTVVSQPHRLCTHLCLCQVNFELIIRWLAKLRTDLAFSVVTNPARLRADLLYRVTFESIFFWLGYLRI